MSPVTRRTAVASAVAGLLPAAIGATVPSKASAMYEYKASLRRIVDGDTVDLDIDLGFSVHSHQRCRLAHIDTPETNAKDEETRRAGQTAKARLALLLHEPEVTIRSMKPFAGDKYGRYLVEIVNSEGVYVNKQLLDEGYAKPYEGGTKE